MKNINITRENKNDWKSMGVNFSFGMAYLRNLEAGNEILNIEEFYLDEHVSEIVENCKKFGIKEFTISSEMSGLVRLLEKLENLGVKIDKLVRVKSQYTDRNGEHEIVPAIKMIID